MSTDIEVTWQPTDMVEVTLGQPDDFLKVRETLTRIGVASRKERKLYQSCHILHKQGKYYIVHFKELFALDGKSTNLSLNDVQRRNRIIQLLSDWGLVSVVDSKKFLMLLHSTKLKFSPLKKKTSGLWKVNITSVGRRLRYNPNKPLRLLL